MEYVLADLDESSGVDKTKRMSFTSNLILVDCDLNHLLVFIITPDKDIVIFFVSVEHSGVLRKGVGNPRALAFL